MAALNNQIAAADVVTALDVEFAANFDGSVNQLAEVLGIFGVERIRAGQAMYQYVVTGELNTDPVAEGDETPLSKYRVDKQPIGEMAIEPFRKLTTAQAILKSGYRNAVLRTDDKMAKNMRSLVLGRFFDTMKAGTLRAQSSTLQGVLARISANMGDELERNNDSAERYVYFVNRQDAATYLESAQITTQTLFGMDYLESFVGVSNVFFTANVEPGYVYATPVENIRLYGCDFAELASGGLAYMQSDSGLIGVHHEPAYNRTACETYALLGFSMLAEVVNYIARGRIGKAIPDMTVDELKALASAEGVDISGKTTKDDIASALTAAGVE